MTDVTFVFDYCTITARVDVVAMDDDTELAAINIARVSVQDSIGIDPVNTCQEIVLEAAPVWT